MTSPINPVQRANRAELLAHSEQALVELIYIRTANELLGSAMHNLDRALNSTQRILSILQKLQNLHNQIEVRSKSAFNFDFRLGPSSIIKGTTDVRTDVINAPTSVRGTFRDDLSIGNTVAFPSRATTHFQADITDYQRAYMQAASAYFGQAIDPTFIYANSASPGYASYVASLRALKQELRREISVLFRQTPPADRDDPSNLLNTVRKVFEGLPSNFQFSTVQKWVLDNYNRHSTQDAGAAGQIQNDLTLAITAAQSLNDSQKEKVRRFLFIFQEYYQSASAILSKITQIIEKMAQKISQ